MSVIPVVHTQLTSSPFEILDRRLERFTLVYVIPLTDPVAPTTSLGQRIVTLLSARRNSAKAEASTINIETILKSLIFQWVGFRLHTYLN